MILCCTEEVYVYSNVIFNNCFRTNLRFHNYSKLCAKTFFFESFPYLDSSETKPQTFSAIESLNSETPFWLVDLCPCFYALRD